MFLKSLFCLAGVFPALLSAAVVGSNPPSLPLTAERIARLPADIQPAWRGYLERSITLRAADQKFLADEIKAHAIKAPVPVTQNRANPRFSGNRPAVWYASAEARQLAVLMEKLERRIG